MFFFAVSCDDSSTNAPVEPEEPEEPETPLVSIFTEPDTLIESQEMTGEVRIEVEGDMPDDEDFIVALQIAADDGSSKPLARFKITQFNEDEDLDGAELAEDVDISELDRLVLRMTDNTARISLTVNDDDFDNGPLDVVFSIEPAEEFDIDEDHGSAAFTIIENEE
ncbi:MAG: hypothetical protein ACOC2C_04330 [Cyclonatronaceae bacterium]